MTLRVAADPATLAPRPRASVRVATAATMLDCDQSTIRRLARDGTLETHRLGKRGIRVYVDAIERYQAQHAAGVVVSGAPAPRPRPTPAHREALAFLQKHGIG